MDVPFSSDPKTIPSGKQVTQGNRDRYRYRISIAGSGSGLDSDNDPDPESCRVICYDIKIVNTAR